MTDTTQNIIAPAPATTGAPTPKPAEAKKNGKPKASKKRAGRQRRRGAAHSDSEPEEAADSDGSDSSSEDESEVSEDDDDDDDEEEEAEAEDSDSGAGAGKTIQTGSKAVLADANSVPAVWNTPSSADAEVIQFGGSSSAVVGVETGNGNSNGNAKAKAELRSRKKLSEAQLAKLKEKRERQIAKQKEKRKAAKVAKAEKAAAAKAGAGEGGAEGSEIAGSSSQAKADESKPQPADEVEKDDDTASDGGWGPAAGEASSAGIEIIPGAILPPSPKPTGPTSGKKVKGKKGKQGDNADTDGLVQSTQSMSMRDQEAGPSRQNQARPPRGPRRSQASSEHFDNGQYHQQSGQPGGGGYPAQSHRGGRGGFGPGGMRGGRGGFRGGMNGVPMNGHMGMGMGMGIRGRGRANPFSAFAPRYLPQETGEKDGRLEMDKIEDEERERKERARAAREERERLEAEREERERKEAEKEVKRLAAGGVDDDGWGEVRDDVDPSAVKPTEGNGDDAEDVEAEIDAFLASAAAALEAPVKAGKPVSLAISSATASTVKPSTTAAAPGPVKSGVDGKWGHEAFEHQQQMDLARAANGATGMRGNGRGRGRGRGFGARGGFIPQPQMHGQFNPGRPQQFPPSYPSFGVSSPLAQAGLNGPSHSAEPVPVAATPAAAPLIATTTQAAGATAQTTADDLLDNTPSSTGAVTIHLPGSGPSVQVPLVPLAQTASRDTSAAEPSASGSAAVHPKPLPPHLTGASHISHQSQSSQHSAHSFGSQPVSQGLSRPGSAAAPAFEPASRPLNRAQLALLHSQGIGATPAGEYYRLDSGAPVPTPFVQQLVSQSRNSSASFPRQPIHSTHSSYSHNQNAYAGMPAQSPMFYPDAMAIGADGRPMSPASYNPYADSSAMGTPPLPMHIPLGMQQMQAVQPALPGAGYFVPATSGRKVSIRAPGAEVSESRDTGSAAAKGREMPEEQTSSAQSPGPQQSPSTQSQQASQAYNPYANTYQPMAYDPQMQAQMQAQMQMQHMQMQQMGMGMGLSMGMQAGGYPGQQALDAQLAMGHHQALSGHDQGQGQGQAPYGWYDQSAYYQENYGY